MNTRLMIVTLLYIGLAAPSMFAAEPIGSIVSIQGEAVAVDAKGQERKLALKSPVFMNDKLITRAGGKLQLMFNDDSILSEGESSELVIDEYVYSPKTKEENSCGLSVLKGVVRVITGKVTDLNPKRFKVNTRMASIGIRGCELGFRMDEGGENVYVVQLPQDRTITVSRMAGVAQGDANAQQIIEVTKQRMVVSIVGDRAMSMRAMRPGEFKALVLDCSPEKAEQKQGTGEPGGDKEGDKDEDKGESEYGSFDTDAGIVTTPIGGEQVEMDPLDISGIGDRIDIALDTPTPPPIPPTPPVPPTPPTPPTPTPTLTVSGKALGTEYNGDVGYESLAKLYLYTVSGDLEDNEFNGAASGYIYDHDGAYIGAATRSLTHLPVVPYGSKTAYKGYTEVTLGFASMLDSGAMAGLNAVPGPADEAKAAGDPILLAYDNLGQFFRYINPADPTCALSYGGYASRHYGVTLPSDALLKYDVKCLSYRSDYFYGDSPGPGVVQSANLWINTRTGAFMSEEGNFVKWGYVDMLEFFGKEMQGVGQVFSGNTADKKTGHGEIIAGFRDASYLGTPESGSFSYLGYGAGMLLKTLPVSGDIGVTLYRSANEADDSTLANEGQFAVTVDRGAYKKNVTMEGYVYEDPSAPASTDPILTNPEDSFYVKGKLFAASWGPDNGGIMLDAVGGGEDWTWGQWNSVDGTVDSESQLDAGLFSGVFAVGKTLSASAYQALAGGPTSYSLNTPAGSPGTAAAYVSLGNSGEYISGPCLLSVTVPGNGNTAAWSGTFALGSEHGSRVALNFNMSGNISAYGHLNGSSDSYQLVINGVAYDLSTLISQGATGSLVGNGSGATPVSGAIGQFYFEHGGGSVDPKVSGVYGTDLL